jgi:DNA modification methylase
VRFPEDYIGRVIHGDCLEVMREMPDGSIDSVVTDPPFSFAGGLSNGRTSVKDEGNA